MPYIVTAKISANSNRRVESKQFATKKEATQFARATRRDRPGSNPRVKKVKA